MKTASPEGSRGFSLVEMLVTIFIFGLLMLGSVKIEVLLFQQSDLRGSALSSIDSIREFGMIFNNQIRNAQSGNDGSYALGEASSTEIIFFSPYGAVSSSTVLRVRYYLSGGTLYKGVVTPTGSPLAYNLGSEVVRTVVTGVMNTSTPAFSYYNGSYAGTSSPLSQPVNTTQVSFVSMNLIIKQQDTRTASTSFNFVTGASMRTLKTNLGN